MQGEGKDEEGVGQRGEERLGLLQHSIVQPWGRRQHQWSQLLTNSHYTIPLSVCAVEWMSAVASTNCQKAELSSEATNSLEEEANSLHQNLVSRLGGA